MHLPGRDKQWQNDSPSTTARRSQEWRRQSRGKQTRRCLKLEGVGCGQPENFPALFTIACCCSNNRNAQSRRSPIRGWLQAKGEQIAVRKNPASGAEFHAARGDEIMQALGLLLRAKHGSQRTIARLPGA